MSTKGYSVGSAPELSDEGCRMLYKVMLIARHPWECGAITVSSTITVSGYHNAEAFEKVFKNHPLIEVVIRPDVFGYMRRMHPSLDTSVSLDP